MPQNNNASSKTIFIKRIIMTTLGVLGGGFCVSLFRMSVFGVDPFQALMGGIAITIPRLSFGVLYVVINSILLLFAFLLKRSLIGLGTIINLTLLGFVADYSHRFFLMFFPYVNMMQRMIFLLLGIVLICLFSSLYFVANMGVSTYDAVALILSEKYARISFKYWRIITDSCCVVMGVALFLMAGETFSAVANIVGIGTIITAFFMGPLISFFSEKVAKPLLNAPH